MTYARSNPLPERVEKAAKIAFEACSEMQPMPTEGVSPLLIAEACESIGDKWAKEKFWRMAFHAHRMACWYYRKQLDQ
jgi:hypothetical protein